MVMITIIRIIGVWIWSVDLEHKGVNPKGVRVRYDNLQGVAR